MRPNYRQDVQWTLGTEVRVEIEMMTILEVEVDLSQGEGRSLTPDLIPG